MHISFDSIDELDAFVARWISPDEVRASGPIVKVFDAYACQGGVTPMTQDFGNDPDGVQGDNESAPIAGEAPKRKRRTKAEIAADEAAAAKAAEKHGVHGGEGATLPDSAVEVKGNPFAAEASAPAAAIQAILDAPNQQAASLAGMAAVSMNALPEDMPTTVTKQAKPTDPEIIKSWIRDTAVGNIGPVDLMAHMTRAKAFIAKHGTAKYNESYALAGLTPNIMEYEDEQRSIHAAALEFAAWE